MNWSSSILTKLRFQGQDHIFLRKICFSSFIGHWSKKASNQGPRTRDKGRRTQDKPSIYLRLFAAFRLFLSVLTFTFLSACDEGRVYEENVDFDNKKWVVDTVPSFEFKIEDSSKPYNIYWNVRNTVAYPYRNLYLTYYIEDTTGRRITTDLHNMLLFEPKTGKPYGSGLGDIFSHQFMALPDFKFDQAGVYRVRLEQYMRTDTLPEIVSVGMRVEDAGVGS